MLDLRIRVLMSDVISIIATFSIYRGNNYVILFKKFRFESDLTCGNMRGEFVLRFLFARLATFFFLTIALIILPS